MAASGVPGLTLTTLLTDLYSELRYAASTPTSVTDRLTRYLNRTHRELLTIPGMTRLRDDTFPITTVANQAQSGLPPAISRIQGIVDRVNNHKLKQVPLEQLRLMDPSQAFVAGYPLRYAVVGERHVQTQPAAATGVWAVSSSASDTTQKVYLETILTGGYINYPSSVFVTLNGTTRVQFGARTDIINVSKFYLDLTGAVGFVSLFDAAVAGNELARIPPQQTYARYLTVEWHPIPTTAQVLYVDATRQVIDLVNGGDEPLIPSDFHYVMHLGALAKEYTFLDDSRAAQARADYAAGMRALKSWVGNDGDRLASLRSIPRGWSPLGSSFPAERNV